MLCVNTNFAIDHFVLKITWITERQSYENTLSLVKSAWIWTIQRKFISHFSIGSKAACDKVNQIVHVQKSRGSLGTTNMAANQERAWAFRLKERLFSAFGVLIARGKLNIVFLSCERKCWTALFKVATKNVLWMLFMFDKLTGTENWLNWRHLEHTKTTPSTILAW